MLGIMSPPGSDFKLSVVSVATAHPACKSSVIMTRCDICRSPCGYHDFPLVWDISEVVYCLPCFCEEEVDAVNYCSSEEEWVDPDDVMDDVDPDDQGGGDDNSSTTTAPDERDELLTEVCDSDFDPDTPPSHPPSMTSGVDDMEDVAPEDRVDGDDDSSTPAVPGDLE
jgi:hypothetical protein